MSDRDDSSSLAGAAWAVAILLWAVVAIGGAWYLRGSADDFEDRLLALEYYNASQPAKLPAIKPAP